MAGAKLAYQNLQWLGPLKFTEEEQEFAEPSSAQQVLSQRG